MQQLKIFDRRKKTVFIEKIYGLKPLKWLYRTNILAYLVRVLVSCCKIFSKLYGLWHKSFFSRKKILPFISKFDIDVAEFEKKPAEFSSFNSFFIRKLKPSMRPIASSDAVLPADGRYLAFASMHDVKNFFVKEQKFALETFLQDRALAEKYADGSMLIARLAPVDCHRFYFPVDCLPEKPKLINGCLFSVNPIALRKSLKNFLQNKRVLTVLNTEQFKQVLFIEIGATNVGSIVQTCQVGKNYKKGQEKGYFELGGSSLVLLFQKDTVKFDQDLIENSLKGMETYALLGSSLGKIY